jgi:hypothetical protein
MTDVVTWLYMKALPAAALYPVSRCPPRFPPRCGPVPWPLPPNEKYPGVSPPAPLLVGVAV